MNEPIPLSQKIYLLGIHPEKGGIISAAYTAMDYVLLGTLFLELFLNKNVIFENKRIILTNRKSEVRLHQFMIQKLENSKRNLKISRWMNRLYFSLKFIRGEVQQGLVDKRIIKLRRRRFMFFRWNTPAIINTQAVYQLTSAIETQIFKGTANEEEIMLLSFLKPAGLMKRLFPEKEKRKNASRRLNNLMVENQVSQAVADAISASRAVAASVAATAAASAATSS
jgi:hypothetical protein